MNVGKLLIPRIGLPTSTQQDIDAGKASEPTGAPAKSLTESTSGADLDMTTHFDARYQLDTKIPMRDGVELAADLYLPYGEDRVPAVLMRTAFDRAEERAKGRLLASQGYG